MTMRRRSFLQLLMAAPIALRVVLQSHPAEAVQHLEPEDLFQIVPPPTLTDVNDYILGIRRSGPITIRMNFEKIDTAQKLLYDGIKEQQHFVFNDPIGGTSFHFDGVVRRVQSDSEGCSMDLQITSRVRNNPLPEGAEFNLDGLEPISISTPGSDLIL